MKNATFCVIFKQCAIDKDFFYAFLGSFKDAENFF